MTSGDKIVEVLKRTNVVICTALIPGRKLIAG